MLKNSCCEICDNSLLFKGLMRQYKQVLTHVDDITYYVNEVSGDNRYTAFCDTIEGGLHSFLKQADASVKETIKQAITLRLTVSCMFNNEILGEVDNE